MTGAEALITGKLREVCFPEEEKYMFEKMEETGAEALITGKLREVCFPEEEKYMFEKMEEMFKRYQTAQ